MKGNRAGKQSEKSLEKMTKAELIEELKSLQALDQRPTDELRHTVHELEVHQVELEMQNRELRETQQMLEESRNRYADLYDFAPVGYVTLNRRGVIEEINLTGAIMLGQKRSALAGIPFINYVEVSDRERFREHIKQCEQSEEKVTSEMGLATRDSQIFVELSSVAFEEGEERQLRIRTAITDVTEHRRAEEALRQSEERLRHSQKMEAIGTLAGGVAHDFNNLLTAIIGYSSLLLQSIHKDDPMREEVLEIKSAGDRAAALVRQLLAFSRKQMLHYRVLSINDLLNDMSRMLRRLVAEDVKLVMNLDPSTGSLKADPGQIEQIVMNLVVNACDAMPQGGRLVVETSRFDLAEGSYSDQEKIAPGRYAVIEIKDTGCGMDEETLSHIFEPFFTTKETGKGTGLGLSTVYGAVRQMKGHITVESESDAGTTFRIYLPCVEEALEDITEREPPIPARGTETILLVEDEPSVRKMVAESLREYGYKVIEAGDGEEALRIVKQRDVEKIHLLLTDVVMPQMNGPVLVERLSQMRPELNILYISGHTGDAFTHHIAANSEIPLLPKPFTPDDLRRKVREVLDK